MNKGRRLETEERITLMNMLEEIASDLSINLGGNFVVLRFSDEAIPSYQYIQEEKNRSSNLGFLPFNIPLPKKRKLIFQVHEKIYPVENGKAKIEYCLRDERAKEIVEEHLREYTTHLNPSVEFVNLYYKQRK